MKLFNIEKTENLYSAIANCEGPVELVLSGNRPIPLDKDAASVAKVLSFLPVNGKIDEMELNFQNNRDVRKMMSVLMSIA